MKNTLLLATLISSVVTASGAFAMHPKTVNPNWTTNCSYDSVWLSSGDGGTNQSGADAWRKTPRYAKWQFCSHIGL